MCVIQQGSISVRHLKRFHNPVSLRACRSQVLNPGGQVWGEAIQRDPSEPQSPSEETGARTNDVTAHRS